MIDLIAAAQVVPVVTIADPQRAVDVCRALFAGGLPAVEITLRTPDAIECIRQAAAAGSEVVVGAGSVTSASAVDAVVDSGAQFVVSPGLSDDVVEAAQQRGVPVIPGVATATELMRALALGVDVVKLFPAEAAGGTQLVAALSAVWPEVRFMPTGGISPQNAREYLALPQVLAVGGSWMVPRAAVEARDWHSITAAAAACVEMGSELG